MFCEARSYRQNNNKLFLQSQENSTCTNLPRLNGHYDYKDIVIIQNGTSRIRPEAPGEGRAPR